MNIKRYISIALLALPMCGMAQITQQQTIGAPNTQITSRGYFDTDTAIHMPSDTPRNGRKGSLAIIGAVIWIQAAHNTTDSSWQQAFIAVPVTIGAIDSLSPVANGAVANNNRINLQTVKITGQPGELGTTDYNHFLTTYRYWQNSHATNLVGYPDTAVHSYLTAADNIILGSQAGIAMTTGVRNFGAGSFALNANTTGSRNIAIGLAAVESNTVGNDQIGIGFDALANCNGSMPNIAIGTLCLTQLNTGQFNTAIGYEAMQDATSSSNNTIMGYGAAQTCTTGSTNTAVGALALARLSTGTGNTAMGYGSNSSCSASTAINNTSYGTLSMDFNVHGGNNTVMGFHAMAQDSVGNSNIAIGATALTGFNNLNNLAIGNCSLYGIYPAFNSGTRGSTNTIAIGDSSFFFTAGSGVATTNCIFIGRNINVPTIDDTARVNVSVFGDGVHPDTNNICILGTQTQTIRLGNGGMTGLAFNAAPEEASNMQWVTDSSTYVEDDGTYKYKWRKILTGSFSQAVTAVTTFTIPLPTTLASTSYTVQVTPTAVLSAAAFYVTAKTTTSFQVVYLTAITGTVTFDWNLTQ
jgi:hypothetical protein